jgi:UDP-2,3-diacylglucosamine pyrophosphatase LpxH
MTLKVSYRTIFLSDIHMGSSSARVDEAAAFLKYVDCQTLYLVGDIIDMWRLKSRWYWPEANNKLVRRVLKMAKRGTRVVYIPGNHDDAARQFVGLNFGGVIVERNAIHVTADGRKLLVTHGDEADVVIKHARLLSVIGGVAYDNLVVLNRWMNKAQRAMGRRPWSLSHAIKMRVKKACQHIAKFEEALVAQARDLALDGVVCGHIHKAEVRRNIGDIETEGQIDYFNCGDWVEGATALVEHDDGTMQVLDGAAFLEQMKTIEATEDDDVVLDASWHGPVLRSVGLSELDLAEKTQT